MAKPEAQMPSIMNMRLRVLLRRWRRRTYESFGSDRYSHPSLYDIDRKLQHWLSFRHGRFLEAGANDGYQQSNTYFLERMRGWSGVLVEPVPWLAVACRRNRPRSLVVQAALVPFDYADDTIELDYSDLTSCVAGAFGDDKQRQEHQHKGLKVQPSVRPRRVRVPARTLLEVCESTGMTGRFDFLSLDVEGAEPMALRGLDFDRVRPDWMLVEVRDMDTIGSLMGSAYEIEMTLTKTNDYQDVLFRRRK